MEIQTMQNLQLDVFQSLAQVAQDRTMSAQQL